jgi:hypothetical protein
LIQTIFNQQEIASTYGIELQTLVNYVKEVGIRLYGISHVAEADLIAHYLHNIVEVNGIVLIAIH